MVPRSAIALRGGDAARLVFLKLIFFIMDASTSVGSGALWRYKIYATDTLQCECLIKKKKKDNIKSFGLCMVRGTMAPCQVYWCLIFLNPAF
jgi:hypothetical protein